ncbi:MAG: DMT family transporter [Patescibacteria group bacterium]|nr:DMT family transporter [Patescibacteria group bacterium]
MPWYFLILISAFLLGIYAIFQKEGLKKADPVAFTFLISLTIAIYTIPIAFLSSPFTLPGNLIILLAIKSISAAIFFVLSAKALKHMELSEFAPLLNLSPLILLVLSFFILDERVGFLGLVGIFLIVSGSYILELKDGYLSPFKNLRDNKYIHILVVGLLFASFCAILDRYILTNVSDIWSFFILNNWLILLSLTIIMMLEKNALKNIKTAFRASYIWIIIGSLIYTSGDFIYFSTLMIPAAFVSLVIPIKRTSTLVSTIVGGEILKEKNLLRKIIACIVMILGIYFIAV